MSRVLVIGLDGLDWELASRWFEDLPALAGLAGRGAFGPLESTVPAVTPPAWTGMVTGRNPGHFGFTDFVTRRPGTYAGLQLVHSGLVRADTVFDLADRAGLRTLSLSVPVSYPPPSRRHGAVLSCLLAPGPDRRVVSPEELTESWFRRMGGPPLFDVTPADPQVAGDTTALLRELRRYDDQRFDLATALAREDAWDLLFVVATGTDRVAHYFMHHLDKRHVAHPSEPRHAGAIRDHYRHCDARIAELLDAAGDGTTVLVVSDHGVQRLDGKLSLNDWLAQRGYLRLEGRGQGPRQLADAAVDWSATRAWATGFGGQIFLNRRGRYPHGWLGEREALAVADQLADELASELGGELAAAGLGDGCTVEVARGEDVFSGAYAHLCPDLCLEIDELRVLTRNVVGAQRLLTPPDGERDVASHRREGFLAVAGPDVPAVGRCDGLSIYDVAPTLLELLGLEVPGGLDGHSLVAELDEVYSDADHNALASRLEALYLD